MATFQFISDALNNIDADYGDAGGHSFIIDSYNAWALRLSGGVGAHQFEIDALNEISVLMGGTGNYRFNIDALNAISGLLGGTSAYVFEIDALNAIADLPVFGGSSGGTADLSDPNNSGLVNELFPGI